MSVVKQVLEQFRQNVVASLRGGGFAIPPDADRPGGHFEAVAAWVRVQHRHVSTRPRAVQLSQRLRKRSLAATVAAALQTIQAEIERGADLTPRQTRRFYKAGFNDFLFNTFGIQHLHLGAPEGGWDQTKRQPMCAGGEEMLFALFAAEEAYFLDVLGHEVFDSPDLSKGLVRVALQNWPHALSRYTVPGVTGARLTFEDAFSMQQKGFGTVFEFDGIAFLPGQAVRDGKRQGDKVAAGTSVEVVAAANMTLNRIMRLIEHLERYVAKGAEPRRLDLVVVRAGEVAVVRDQATGIEFFHDGDRFWRSAKEA